jgi:hypothetical protein
MQEYVKLGGGLVFCGAVGSLAAEPIKSQLSQLLGIQMHGVSDYSLSYLRFPRPSSTQAHPFLS